MFPLWRKGIQYFTINQKRAFLRVFLDEMYEDYQEVSGMARSMSDGKDNWVVSL